MGILGYSIEPPTDWQMFERLCYCLWMKIWKDSYAQMHGRQGQKQAGIDIYGNEADTGKLVGIQCKGKDAHYGAQVTEKELRSEVIKALTFSPHHPQIFILATTAPRDKDIQKVARVITKELAATSKMKVVVFAWDDIITRIASQPEVIYEFYPHLSTDSKQLRYNIGEIKDAVVGIKDSLMAPSEAEQKIYDRNQARKYFTEGSNGLLSWPKTLHTSKVWIDRDEEEDIIAKFDIELSSSTIVLGEPGTGKSALLSKIAHSLIGEDEIVLAIKADQLDNSVNDFTSLGLALGLPGPADECLKIASNFGTVYLIIDQLDTLSELVDVKTSRLSVLLNLIRLMSAESNIHILASSRPFEFTYDARLSAIKAHKAQLHKLVWDVVEKILNDHGVHVKDADEQFKNFLCRPSNLNFYLDYLRNNPQKYYQSHIELYEDIWETSLGQGLVRKQRVAFLLNIASTMTTEAKQLLPIARYDEHSEDIGWLVEAGILVKNANNKSFSFAHQTLQAFVWTRSFIKQNDSLSEFILAHQDNLNVRPKLSTALFYLREADDSEYNLQIESILSTNISNIRRHIIHLMIECIGVHHSPNLTEVNLLKGLISDDSFSARICRAVAGKESWFEHFKDDVLPKIMQGQHSSRFGASQILSAVLPQESEAVLGLIDRYWKNGESIMYISQVLERAKEWNERIFALAKFVVTDQKAGPHVIGFLFYSLQARSLEMALTLAAYHFSDKLTFLIKNPPSPPPSISSNSTEIDQYIHNAKYNPKVRFERLLEFGHEWHNLPEVAGKVPDIFVAEFWPFFLRVCDHTKNDYTRETNSYSDCSGIWFHLSDDGKDHRGNYFSEALENAIKLYAQHLKAEFLTLYERAKHIDRLPVQRVLMKGLCEIARSNPDFVLGELLADSRRLKLGESGSKHYSGTVEVISILSKNLEDAKVRSLEQYIISHDSRKDSSRPAESRMYDVSFNRKVRHRLLAAIDSNKLSRDSLKFMIEEERALGKYIRDGFEDGYSGFVSQVSPMSEEQMAKAKDKDIVNCFQAFPDHSDNYWPRDKTYKGATELGRTFEKFAEKEPNRAASIMTNLKSDNVLAVGHGLQGLSKSDMTLASLLNLVSTLERNMACPDLYEDAAIAIKHKLSMRNTLNQEWLKKIEGWLTIKHKEAQQDDGISDAQEEKEPKIESVLWGHNNVYGVPGGNFRILGCLKLGYLLREDVLSHDWANVIVNYIHRGDSVKVWLAFLALDLPRVVHLCSSEDIERIIDAIIEVYPHVIASKEIAFALAECCSRVSDVKMHGWLDMLVQEGTNHSLQVYGELLGIQYVIAANNSEKNSSKTKSRIDAVLKADNNPTLFGLSYTLKNIWKAKKALITPMVIALIDLQNKSLSSILLGILNDHKLEYSPELNIIIDAIIRNKTLAEPSQDNNYLMHSILPLTALEPSRVAQLSEDIITAYGHQLGNVTTAASGETSNLVTISITLHNLGLQYQKVGLSIFEKLMDIDTHHVQEALKKIDLVPTVSVVS